MRRIHHLLIVLFACATAASLLAGCSAPNTTAESPQPAGPTPSAIAKEVCGAKAQGLIGDVLGETAQVSTPTWVNHLYSCDFQYPTGTMVLSVKELSSWNQTYGYFDGLADSLHRVGLPILQLGQGAFRVKNGSVVVRKDWKVVLVDVSSLPSQFGNPASPVSSVALSVAGVILACWHGD